MRKLGKFWKVSLRYKIRDFRRSVLSDTTYTEDIQSEFTLNGLLESQLRKATPGTNAFGNHDQKGSKQEKGRKKEAYRNRDS